MTPAPPTASKRAFRCPRCSALNAASFDRCVRCGARFVALAALDRPRPGLLDGRSLLATKILGGLTFLVFAGQVMAAQARGIGMFSKWHDADYLRFGALLVLPDLPLEPFRLLSAVFAHAGVFHFGMNMLALSNLARIAEPAVGSARFTIAYVVTGVFGFAVSAGYSSYVQPEPLSTLGASGAVCGIMGLILGFLLRRRDPNWQPFALQALFYGVLFGFILNASNAGFRINNAAHVGGLASGVVLGLLYAGRTRGRIEGLVNAGAVGSLLACLAALALAQRTTLVMEGDASRPPLRRSHGCVDARGAGSHLSALRDEPRVDPRLGGRAGARSRSDAARSTRSIS